MRTRSLYMLLIGILLTQFSLCGTKVAVAENTSMSPKNDLILPLGFTPLTLQKPTANASWQGTFPDVTFQNITTLVLELEPLALAGSIESLEVEVTINGRSTTQRYEGSEYSFEAPTQLGLLVDATTRKLDGSTDISLLFKPHWGFIDAGVQITLAQIWSFTPRPAFGEGWGRVPLIAEWNTYHLGSIPPVSLYLTTTGFLGNESGSNHLQLSIYLEILGANAPWVEVFLGTDRLYQGSEAPQWINTTLDPTRQTTSPLTLTVEYHPDRSTDRHKDVALRLEVYAEFTIEVDPRTEEREQVLSDMPKLPEVIANLITLNAILLPLLYFRKKRLEERKATVKSLIRKKIVKKKSDHDFINRKYHNREFSRNLL
ncbi:MAG: hypothetical protein ACFFB3_00375 [Candidatus Hodarchaeota archaeon]